MPELSLVARLGGDEFALVLPNTDLAKVEQKVQEIRSLALGESVQGIPISIALGAAVKTDPRQDFQECFNLAEKRMYGDKLKRKGS